MLTRLAHLLLVAWPGPSSRRTRRQSPAAPRYPSPGSRSTAPLRVELWADSMGMAVGALVRAAARAVQACGRGTTTLPGHRRSATGSATCASEVDPANRRVSIGRPPCSSSPASVHRMHARRHGGELTGTALINKYRADAAAAIAIFTKAHVPVYFASVPISRANAAAGERRRHAARQMYATLPALHPAASRASSTRRRPSSGTATTPTPCRVKRVRRAPVTGRTARRRSWCARLTASTSAPWRRCPPVTASGFSACPVIMPGALRYMRAITTKVLHDFGLSVTAGKCLACRRALKGKCPPGESGATGRPRYRLLTSADIGECGRGSRPAGS